MGYFKDIHACKSFLSKTTYETYIHFASFLLHSSWSVNVLDCKVHGIDCKQCMTIFTKPISKSEWYGWLESSSHPHSVFDRTTDNRFSYSDKARVVSAFLSLTRTSKLSRYVVRYGQNISFIEPPWDHGVAREARGRIRLRSLPTNGTLCRYWVTSLSVQY